ncbi:MAG: hypothetical protein HQL76_18115 [Magnetococcales bacterium]|nr:hypothetical protein [Magnetococcales bacterium]
MPLVEIAERYHVGRDAVRRHLDQHFMEPVEAPIDGTALQGLGVIEEALQRDITRLRELSERALREGDARLAGNLIGQVLRGHEILLASRDRRQATVARLWVRHMASQRWGPDEKITALLQALQDGTILGGDFTPPKPG